MKMIYTHVEKKEYFMKTKKLLIFSALALATGTVLAACGGGKPSSSESTVPSSSVQSGEEGSQSVADPIYYRKDGNYTTQVVLPKVTEAKIADLSPSDIEVRYAEPDNNLVAINPEDEVEESGLSLEEAFPLTAEVKTVKKVGDNYEISFVDKNAKDIPIDRYMILVKPTKEVVRLDVITGYINLTPSVTSISSLETGPLVTLEITGSEFEDGISFTGDGVKKGEAGGRSNFSLGGAFQEMTIQSVSASKKNLTIALSGSPIRNGANIYEKGIIGIKPSAIKNAKDTIRAYIDIDSSEAYLNPETLKFENGNATIDLTARGVVDVADLNRENVTLEGANTVSIEKLDDETVRVTFSSMASSVNDFAASFNGKKLTIGTYETTANLNQASFYPVFDYIEEEGSDFILTIKAFAKTGSFAENINKEKFSFGGELANAYLREIVRESDTMLTLTVSLPSSGQTLDDFCIEGSIELDASALQNPWGVSLSEPSSYNRVYSNDTLGKSLSDDRNFYNDIFAGKNEDYSSIINAQTINDLSNARRYMVPIVGPTEGLNGNERKNFNLLTDRHNKIIDPLITEIDRIQNRTDRAGYVKDSANAILELNESLLDRLIYPGINSSFGKLEYPGLRNIDDNYLTELRLGINIDQTDKDDFQRRFLEIAELISKNGDEGWLQAFDKCCSESYNFDTIAYPYRLQARLFALTSLTRAFSALTLYTDLQNDTSFQPYFDAYKAAMKKIKGFNAISKDEVKANQGTVEPIPRWVSDIATSASMTSAEEAKDALRKNGYEVIEQNLNQGAGGAYVYTGVKYTNVRNNAIKDLAVSTTVTKNPSKEYSKHLGIFTPVTNNFGPSGYDGDLNFEAGGYYIYMYKFSKGTAPGGGVVSSIYYNDDSPGESWLDTDLNKWAGGDDIYLHINYDRGDDYVEEKNYTLTNTNPQYFPYCYSFGRKVALRQVKTLGGNELLGLYYPMMGSLVKPSLYPVILDVDKLMSRRYNSNWTLAQEFAAAGLTLDHPLIHELDQSRKTCHPSFFFDTLYYKGNAAKHDTSTLQYKNYSFSYCEDTPAKKIGRFSDPNGFFDMYIMTGAW